MEKIQQETTKQDSLTEKFWQESLERFAEASELYRERLEFDEEGNLWMTTHDKIATSSVRYRTIGFTIKREEKEIAQTQAVRVKLEETKESLIDPLNRDYCYSYFCIRKETIYQKILLCSEEWADSLYRNGGTLYLDAIMIVVENGVEKGSMQYDGTFAGQVYETYDGIANAKNWADTEALQTHFNKEVEFPGNPVLIEREPQMTEERELLTNGSLVQKEDLPDWNRLILWAKEYEVSEAIPSGETVQAEGNIQKLYYQAEFEHIWGTYTFPIEVSVSYTLTWNDGSPHEEKVTVLDFYEVSRTYSYWNVKDVSVYYLDYVCVNNTALQEQKRIISTYRPEIELVTQQEAYVELPSLEISVEGGSLDGGSRCPAIPYGTMQEKVEEAVAQIKVRNDSFSLDGISYLESGWKEKETDAPSALDSEQGITLTQSMGKIPPERTNESYPSTVTAIYQKVESGETETSEVKDVNAIEVHTPVVCQADISDAKKWNQQANPTEYPSLILGKEFTIELSAKGTHIDKKGYGERDYAAYVKEYRIKFPFEVVYAGDKIRKNTWISLKKSRAAFLLPVDAEEKNETIRIRSVAINHDKTYGAEEYANLNRENTIAETKLTVTITGRMYGFKITNIIDYPRWQSVFWNTVQGKRTDVCYYAGIRNENGESVRDKNTIYLAPVLKGSHPYNPNAGPVGLGYRVEFSFQTIGHRVDAKMGITLKPTYYYVEKDGTGVRRVRIYDKVTLEEMDTPFTLAAATGGSTSKDAVCTWEGSCRIPADVCIAPADTDLKAYIKKKGGRISTQDEIWQKGGYLIVNVDLTSFYGKTVNLNYRNRPNEKNGYCNMWKTEAFQTSRVDSEKNTFTFRQGDVFVFDCTNSIQNDYDTYGTH